MLKSSNFAVSETMFGEMIFHEIPIICRSGFFPNSQIIDFPYPMTIFKWAVTAMIFISTSFATEAEPCRVPVMDEPDGGECAAVELAADDVYMPTLAEMLGAPVDNFSQPSSVSEEMAGRIIDYAKQFIGTRYRRGSKGPKSFDCSGFTSYVFRNFDMSLSASSRAQATQGERVDVTEARPGDLVFFSGRRGGSTVGHVGIVVSADPEKGSIKFIHAATSRGVRIDSYPDGGYYSRRFHSVRRVINS